MKTEKIKALATFLETDAEDAERFEDDYLVYTDKEADEAVAEYIKDSIWAFNAQFYPL